MWFLAWLACGDSSPSKDALEVAEVRFPREDLESIPHETLQEDPPVGNPNTDDPFPTDVTGSGGSGGSGGYGGYYGGSGGSGLTTRTGGSGMGGSGLGARTMGPRDGPAVSGSKYLFLPR